MEGSSSLKINYLAVAVCVVLNMVISLGWYYALSGLWMEANGTGFVIPRNRPEIGPYILEIIANLITVYVLAWLFIKLRVESAVKGALVGLLIGLAFYFVVNYTQNVFSLRTSMISLIDGGVILISWTVSGAILGAWR